MRTCPALAALLLVALPGRALALRDLQPPWHGSLLPESSHLTMVSRVEGRVLGFGSSEPLAGASVQIRDAEGLLAASTVTGEDGRFALESPSGPIRFEVRHPSFQPWNSVEEVGPHKTLSLTLRLRPPDADNVIVVWGERERTEVTRQVFTAEELREIPGSFGDPVRALQSLPGVARPNFLEGNLVVRGAEGINTGFFVDELPVPFLFHTLIGKSVINPAFVSDVEFFPGGMPSRFGEVTQAAVNVRTGTEGLEGKRGLFDLNLLDVGAAVEVGSKDWNFRAAARHSWVSFIVGAVAGVQILRAGGNWHDAFYVYPAYWDVFLSGERKTARLGNWSAMFLASGDGLYVHEPDTDDMQEALDLPYDPQALIDAGFLRMRIRRQAGGPEHRSDTWLAAGTQSQQNLIGNMLVNTEGPWYGRVKGKSIIGRREDTFVRSAKVTYLAGGQATITPVEAENFLDALGDPDDIPTALDTQVSVGVFGEGQYRPGSWFVAPGLRLSYYHFNEESWFQPEPRLTARKKVSDEVVLKGSIGRYTQVPPVDRYAEGLGNADLGLMTAVQGSAGTEWSRGPWLLDTSLYGSVMQHLVVRDLAVDFQSNGESASQTMVPVYREVTGRAYGIEALFRLKPTGSWWGWLAVTLGRSDRKDSETGDVYPGDYDQPIAVTLLASYDAPRDWKFSGRFRFTSGHPFSPYSGSYDPVVDRYSAYPGELNSDRYPVFHQLDVRAEKTWHKPKRDWRLYLDVYNVYNAHNPFAASYDYDYSDLLTIISVPIIPTLGLEATF
jgi:hypothetical protein